MWMSCICVWRMSFCCVYVHMGWVLFVCVYGDEVYLCMHVGLFWILSSTPLESSLIVYISKNTYLTASYCRPSTLLEEAFSSAYANHFPILLARHLPRNHHSYTLNGLGNSKIGWCHFLLFIFKASSSWRNNDANIYSSFQKTIKLCNEQGIYTNRPGMVR